MKLLLVLLLAGAAFYIYDQQGQIRGLEEEVARLKSTLASQEALGPTAPGAVTPPAGSAPRRPAKAGSWMWDKSRENAPLEKRPAK